MRLDVEDAFTIHAVVSTGLCRLSDLRANLVPCRTATSANSQCTQRIISILRHGIDAHLNASRGLQCLPQHIPIPTMARPAILDAVSGSYLQLPKRTACASLCAPTILTFITFCQLCPARNLATVIQTSAILPFRSPLSPIP